MSAPTAVASRPTIGRFELRHELGRGGQATVWLAFDPRLEREVAVKVMSAAAAIDPTAVGEWLAEARSVSRLAHPNLVPLFEADEHERRPYLVFEYVPGPTLAQHLKLRGRLPPHVAVPMAVGVLDALAAAHADGIVHRDVKPSNILVDASGRGRVMDFGIAARLDDPLARDQVVGTPGYLSPEAAAGQAPSAAMDVYSLGLVLIEMLCGERVLTDRDPYRAIERARDEDLTLPAALPTDVDDPLRAVLRKAIARDPASRWPDAEAFRHALQQWLSPPEAEGGAAHVEGNGSGTLEFLLRRMRRKSDFPALSDSISRVQRMAGSDDQSLAKLADEILRDVALTQKLLRYVNSAHFGMDRGGVTTVSRAIALVGLSGIRHLAMSLVLLEHMHDKTHSTQLKEDFLRALMAGMLASEFAAGSRQAEEAFIGAMFQSLGRMLAGFYFPEEAEAVRGLLTSATVEAPVSEDKASVTVLGLSYQELGLGIARHWGLPNELQACIRKPVGEPPRDPREASERLRWSALAANQVADAIYHAEPQQAAARVADIGRRYARTLGLGAGAIAEAVQAARGRLESMADVLQLSVPQRSPANRLLPEAGTHVEAADANERASASASTNANANAHANAHAQARTAPQVRASTVVAATPAASDKTIVLPAVATAGDAVAASTPGDAAERLSAGIQRITDALVVDHRLDDILRMVLDTMHRALPFDRVVFSLRDPKTETMTGRLGVGAGVERVVAGFALTLKGVPDLFNAVCLKGVDTLIADTANVVARLPAWYRAAIDAPTFLLLPLQLNKAPFGLIYADRATRGAIALSDKELALLRTLRNQAVMAFRQLR